ncbi:MAG TPA: M48 family metallopeptidase [Dictyobacter sp.]|nr:M48 family metallopeptidase [Dictyobacter sp.]
MTTTQPKARRRFPELDPVVLQHPYDRSALFALQKIPGLDFIVRKFIEVFPERVAYIQNVAQTVRVSNKQAPQIYNLLHEACAILDVKEPELYIAQTPTPNAYTSGHNRPYIVLTTGIIDLLTEDELLAVIAHELGHIKCGHVLYKTMARGISFLLTLLSDVTLGIGRILGQSFEAALLEWDRKSEFTADRSALLAVQDPQVMLSLMMKLAGGTLFQKDQMDANEFLKQADLYEEVDMNIIDRMYKFMMITTVNHPLIVVRARESMNWSESREYKDILEGHYPHIVNVNGSASSTTGYAGRETNRNSEGPILCPHCGREQANKRYCSLCGGTIL